MDPDDQILNEKFSFFLNEEYPEETGKVVLTEGGELDVFLDEQYRLESIGGIQPSYQGENRKEEKIEISKISGSRLAPVTSHFSPVSTVIKKNPYYCPTEDEEVVIEYDIMCYQPSIPAISSNYIDGELQRSELEYFSVEDSRFSGLGLTDTYERVEFIKETGREIRTGKIVVRQSGRETIQNRIESTREDVERILEVSQLVQETIPVCIRSKIISIDGESAESHDVRYERLTSGSGASSGGRFLQRNSSINDSYQNI